MYQKLNSILTLLIGSLKVGFNKVFNLIKFVIHKEKKLLYLIDFSGLQEVLKWEGHIMSCRFDSKFVDVYNDRN